MICIFFWMLVRYEEGDRLNDSTLATFGDWDAAQ